MLTINTQAPLLGAGNDLNRNQGPLETALERLASGKRVNRAADDPAALAIATRLAEQLLGGAQSMRNLDQQYENTAAAQSRILDTDYARSTAELSHHMILQNAGLAMFGQANVSAGLVDQLLGHG